LCVNISVARNVTETPRCESESVVRKFRTFTNTSKYAEKYHIQRPGAGLSSNGNGRWRTL